MKVVLTNGIACIVGDTSLAWTIGAADRYTKRTQMRMKCILDNSYVLSKSNMKYIFESCA